MSKRHVLIRLESCEYCENCRVNRSYTEDGFEINLGWDCTLVNKKIVGYYELSDPIPEIPEWCPLLEENKKKEI